MVAQIPMNTSSVATVDNATGKVTSVAKQKSQAAPLIMNTDTEAVVDDKTGRTVSVKPKPESSSGNKTTVNQTTRTRYINTPFIYQDLGSAIGRMLYGNSHNPTYAQQKEKEAIARQHANDSQIYAQKEQQNANRWRDHAREEASLDGAAEAAAKSAQAVNNGQAAGAGAAGAQRVKLYGDPNQFRNLGNAAQDKAAEYMTQKRSADTAAVSADADAVTQDYNWNQRAGYNSISDTLSMGVPREDKETTVTTTKEEAVTEPKEEPAQPKEEPVQPKEEPKPEPTEANGQRVMNHLLGSSHGQNLKGGEAWLWNDIQRKYNVKAVPFSEQRNYYPKRVYNNADLWEEYYASRTDQYGTSADKHKAINELRRIRGKGNVSKNLTQGKGNEQSGYIQVPKTIVDGVTAGDLQ